MKPDSLPSIEKNFFGIPMDKMAHFLMFIPYPILAVAVFYRREKTAGNALIVFSGAAATGLMLAYATEIIQAHIGYRSYDIHDFAADASGLAAGCIMTAAMIICDRYRKR